MSDHLPDGTGVQGKEEPPCLITYSGAAIKRVVQKNVNYRHCACAS